MLTTLLVALGVGAGAARAQDTVVVRIGGDLSARTGDTIEVPVVVDLSKAPTRRLASYDISLSWDSTLLTSLGVTGNGFATPFTSSGPNSLRATALQPSGASGIIEVFRLRLLVRADTATSVISATVAELTGVAPTFDDLAALNLQIVTGSFCRSRGRWGDVDSDGQSNSRDALAALSAVVGLPPAAGFDLTLGDVDADGAVTSRDALIILSHAVGLPVTGYRILLTAAGACATGQAITVTVTPGAIALVPGQQTRVNVQARDSTGRSVPLTGLIWRTSDGNVAAMDSGFIRGRSPGSATLTAELGPGIRGTLSVNVLARRRNWIVNATAVNVPTQTGDAAFPLAFIGDAVLLGTSGDTIRVASGTYPEVVVAAKSFVVLGDSINRPVIDPTLTTGWPGADADAVALGERSTPMALLHVVVQAGSVTLQGRGVTARRVHIRLVEGNGTAFAIDASPDPLTGGAPGSVLVEDVVVDTVTRWGISIVRGDTVVLRHDSVTTGNGFSSTEGCSGNVSDEALLRVQASVRAIVEDNRIRGGECRGISVVADSLATIRRNRVEHTGYAGITAVARHVALDHNALRDMRSDGSQAAILFFDGVIDTLTMRGDTIIDAGAAGVHLDDVAVALIDSLWVDGTGADSSNFRNNEAVASDRPGARIRITNSRVVRTGRDFSVNDGIRVTGDHAVVETRGNRITNVGGSSNISAAGIYFCGISCPNGLDSAISVHDTIIGAGTWGIYVDHALYARVDSAVIDSTGSEGLEFARTHRAVVHGVRQRRSMGSSGFSFEQSDTLTMRDSRFGVNQGFGMVIQSGFLVDTLRIANVLADSNVADALALFGAMVQLDSVVLRADSAMGLSMSGINIVRAFDTRFEGIVGADLGLGGGPSLFVARRSRFIGSLVGLRVAGGAVGTVAVHQSNFTGSPYSVENLDGLLIVDADTNYWNDPSGPPCDIATTGFSCPGTGTTDSLATTNVTFAGFLTGAAVSPAPPIGMSALRRSAHPPMPARSRAPARREVERALVRPARTRAAGVNTPPAPKPLAVPAQNRRGSPPVSFRP